MVYLKSFNFNTLKKSHGKGTFHRQTDTQTNRRPSRLLDRIGPVGRFGENCLLYLLLFRRCVVVKYGEEEDDIISDFIN